MSRNSNRHLMIGQVFRNSSEILSMHESCVQSPMGRRTGLVLEILSASLVFMVDEMHAFK